MIQNTAEKDCSKIKDSISSSKKLTTDNFEFVWAKKKTDTEMKSKTRKEERKKRRTRSRTKERIHKNGDGEKNR